MAQPTPKGQSPGSHDRQALLQAFKDVVRSEQEKHTGAPGGGSQPSAGSAFRLAMGLVAFGLAATLFLQPAWLFPRAPEESPALREASVRVLMYVAIERIEQFRAEHGDLPQSLLEAGSDTTGLSYTVGPNGYSLTGQNRGVTVTYSSGTSPREFLGNSYQLIAQRRGT